jgi:hypothetical protein
MPKKPMPTPPPVPKAAAAAPASVPITANTRRVFASVTGDPPFPVYINGAEFMGIGADVVADFGVISPESAMAGITAVSGSDTIPTFDFHVLSRFAMSVPTAVLLHQKLSAILAQIPKHADAILAGMDAKETKK